MNPFKLHKMQSSPMLSKQCNIHNGFTLTHYSTPETHSLLQYPDFHQSDLTNVKLDTLTQRTNRLQLTGKLTETIHDTLVCPQSSTPIYTHVEQTHNQINVMIHQSAAMLTMMSDLNMNFGKLNNVVLPQKNDEVEHLTTVIADLKRTRELEIADLQQTILKQSTKDNSVIATELKQSVESLKQTITDLQQTILKQSVERDNSVIATELKQSVESLKHDLLTAIGDINNVVLPQRDDEAYRKCVEVEQKNGELTEDLRRANLTITDLQQTILKQTTAAETNVKNNKLANAKLTRDTATANAKLIATITNLKKQNRDSEAANILLKQELKAASEAVDTIEATPEPIEDEPVTKTVEDEPVTIFWTGAINGMPQKPIETVVEPVVEAEDEPVVEVTPEPVVAETIDPSQPLQGMVFWFTGKIEHCSRTVMQSIIKKLGGKTVRRCSPECTHVTHMILPKDHLEFTKNKAIFYGARKRVACHKPWVVENLLNGATECTVANYKGDDVHINIHAYVPPVVDAVVAPVVAPVVDAVVAAVTPVAAVVTPVAPVVDAVVAAVTPVAAIVTPVAPVVAVIPEKRRIRPTPIPSKKRKDRPEPIVSSQPTKKQCNLDRCCNIPFGRISALLAHSIPGYRTTFNNLTPMEVIQLLFQYRQELISNTPDDDTHLIISTSGYTIATSRTHLRIDWALEKHPTDSKKDISGHGHVYRYASVDGPCGFGHQDIDCHLCGGINIQPQYSYHTSRSKTTILIKDFSKTCDIGTLLQFTTNKNSMRVDIFTFTDTGSSWGTMKDSIRSIYKKNTLTQEFRFSSSGKNIVHYANQLRKGLTQVQSTAVTPLIMNGADITDTAFDFDHYNKLVLNHVKSLDDEVYDERFRSYCSSKCDRSNVLLGTFLIVMNTFHGHKGLKYEEYKSAFKANVKMPRTFGELLE